MGVTELLEKPTEPDRDECVSRAASCSSLTDVLHQCGQRELLSAEVQTEPINQKTKWRSCPKRQNSQLFGIMDQLQLRRRLLLREVFNQHGQHVCANCRVSVQHCFPSATSSPVKTSQTNKLSSTFVTFCLHFQAI